MIRERLGASRLPFGWPHSANLFDARPVDGGLVVTMMFSLVYIYYAYTGWNGASYLAGEIRNPQEVLPRAILLGTIDNSLTLLRLSQFWLKAIEGAVILLAVGADSSIRGYVQRALQGRGRR